MKAFTIYDPATGQIASNSVAASLADVVPNARPGHVVVEGNYPAAAFYFLNRVATERGDAEISINGPTLSGLPDPCIIELIGAGERQTVTGGSFTLDKPAGRYGLRVTSIAYKDRMIPVTI